MKGQDDGRVEDDDNCDEVVEEHNALVRDGRQEHGALVRDGKQWRDDGRSYQVRGVADDRAQDEEHRRESGMKSIIAK